MICQIQELLTVLKCANPGGWVSADEAHDRGFSSAFVFGAFTERRESHFACGEEPVA